MPVAELFLSQPIAKSGFYSLLYRLSALPISLTFSIVDRKEDKLNCLKSHLVNHRSQLLRQFIPQRQQRPVGYRKLFGGIPKTAPSVICFSCITITLPVVDSFASDLKPCQLLDQLHEAYTKDAFIAVSQLSISLFDEGGPCRLTRA
jgi:hypothetical protein